MILKQLRENKNISVSELAEGLEVTYGYIYKIEKGNKQASYKLIEKYSNFFNIPYTVLLVQYIADYKALNKAK